MVVNQTLIAVFSVHNWLHTFTGTTKTLYIYICIFKENTGVGKKIAFSDSYACQDNVHLTVYLCIYNDIRNAHRFGGNITLRT